MSKRKSRPGIGGRGVQGFRELAPERAGRTLFLLLAVTYLQIPTWPSSVQIFCAAEQRDQPAEGVQGSDFYSGLARKIGREAQLAGARAVRTSLAVEELRRVPWPLLHDGN